MEASTSVAEVTADFNDDQLRELARPPADRLFPLLRHAAAMRPLVVLAAVLPGLLALHGAQVNAIGSRLNLRTLDLSIASTVDFLQVESSSNNLLFRHTAPLTSWLEVAWLDLFGTEFHAIFVLTQFLSAAAIVGLSFALGHRLGGMRMGLFSAMLVSCQPQLLWSVQTAGLGGFPTAMALVSLWSVHKLWEEQISSFSLTQVLAGTGAAFCALSGGPMIIALASCLILNRCAWDGILWCQDHSSATKNKRRRVSVRGWKSLGIIAIHVLLLAGWWYLWMFMNFGTAFVIEWFQPWLGSGATPAKIDWGPQGRASQFYPGILSGLTLLGCVYGVKEFFSRQPAGRELRRSESVWLLTWVGTAGLFWAIAEYAVRDCPVTLEIWRLFLTVPLTMSAAWGVVQIADRRVPLRQLIAYAAFSLIVSLLQARSRPGDPSYLYRTETLLIAIIAIVPVASWQLLRWRRQEDRRERLILSLVTLSLVGYPLVDALLIAPRDLFPPGELQSLSRDFSGVGPVGRVVFVSRSETSPELEYLVRSRWPKLHVSHVTNWNSGMSNIVQHRASSPPESGELLVCWDISEANRFKDLQNPVVVTPAISSRNFLGKELNVFVCETFDIGRNARPSPQ